MEATDSQELAVGRPLLGRFALRLLVVPKPREEPVQQDQVVVEACTREAVVQYLISRVAVGDTMEAQEVRAMVVVVAGVQVILLERSFSIYRALIPEMEM